MEQQQPHGGSFLTCTALVTFLLLASSSPAVTRLGVTRTLTPSDLLMLRCVVGMILFLPYLAIRLPQIPRRLLVMGFLLAFFHGWGMHLATILGLQYAPSAHASALGPGFVSVWVALWGWLLYGIRPSRYQRHALMFIAIGAILLVVNSGVTSFASRTLLGDAFFLCSSGLAAVYLVYAQRHQLSPMLGAALICVYSGAVVVPWFLLSGTPSALSKAPWQELALQIFYQGFAVGAFLMILISYIVVRMGSQRFSIAVASVPVLALLFGRWIVGDGISLGECMAIAFICAGIVYGAMRGASASLAKPIARQPLASSRS